MTPVRPSLSAAPPAGATTGLLGRLAILALITMVSLPLLVGLRGLWRLTALVRDDAVMTRWADGSRHGPWLAVFDGYGRTAGRTAGGEETISLAPRSAVDPAATHAALVVSADRYADIQVSAQVRTVRQLRTAGPQPWEVGWILWHYTDTSHFYAFTLKTNGWELSKQDPAYPGGQRFLASGGIPHAAVATWYTIEITQVDGRITVVVDGMRTADLTDPERPYLSGAVGLYCEDSEVEFRRVTVDTGPPAVRPRP
jgi:hypothetical protein